MLDIFRESVSSRSDASERPLGRSGLRTRCRLTLGLPGGSEWDSYANQPMRTISARGLSRRLCRCSWLGLPARTTDQLCEGVSFPRFRGHLRVGHANLELEERCPPYAKE